MRNEMFDHEVKKEKTAHARHSVESAREKRRRRVIAKLLRLLPMLAMTGVVKVRLQYEGSYDSQNFGDLDFLPENSDVLLPDNVRGVLVDLARTGLPSGWCGEEGSRGEMTIETNSCKVRFDHYWRKTVEDPEPLFMSLSSGKEARPVEEETEE